jgi:hypothetical protein
MVEQNPVHVGLVAVQELAHLKRKLYVLISGASGQRFGSSESEGTASFNP